MGDQGALWDLHSSRALDERNIYCRLDRVRNAVMVDVSVPGRHWGVEFSPDGWVDAEPFTSDGEIEDSSVLNSILGQGG